MNEFLLAAAAPCCTGRMPRRSKSSPAEDFMSAMSHLPWWACVAVGCVIYLILHAIASQPAPVVTSANQMASLMVGSFLRAD